MFYVYQGSVVSVGCTSDGLEFKTMLGGWLFIACWVSLVCMCFSRLYLLGMSASVSLDY